MTALNCRHGDMAFIVSLAGVCITHVQTGEQQFLTRLGTIVECGALEIVNGVPSWRLVNPIPFNVRFTNGRWFSGKVASIADKVLRPLRDPDDDEVDEILLKVGKPGEVRCPALVGNGE